MKYLNTLTCSSIVLILSSCSLSDKYETPVLELPEQHDDRMLKSFSKDNWWTVFGDSVLNNLIEEGLLHSSTIKEIAAKVDEARAVAGIAFADFLPSIGLGAKYSRQAASDNSQQMRQFRNLTGGLSSPIASITTSHSVGMQLSYEADLWGKFRNSNSAAHHRFLASQTAAYIAKLTLSSEIAKTYFTLRALDDKIKIAKRTYKSRNDIYKIYSSRFKNGYCTELDLMRVLAEKESVKIMLIELENALQKVETGLSVLIGKSPKDIVEQTNTRGLNISKINIVNLVPKNLPSDLLNRRPDIVQAELMLMAANANIGAARAAFFPSISLTSALGVESCQLSSLFDGSSSFTWSLAPSITLPFFQAGRIKNNVAAANARYRQLLANYIRTVQIAFKEASDAIYNNRKARESLSSRANQTDSLRRCYTLAEKQQESGMIGLVDLLDVERNLLSSEIMQVSAMLDMLCAIVELCKAIGGGWSNPATTMVPKAAEK